MTQPNHSPQHQPDQAQINNLIIKSLDDIKTQNKEVLDKIDNLEATLTKKAITYGAMAGAITGTASSGMFTVAMEIVRAKFGG